MQRKTNAPNYKSINRLLSQRGYCSRKEAEALIQEGKVKANGKTIFEPFKIVPTDAEIEIVGKTIPTAKTLYYAVMNKRRGKISTSKDERERATVYEDLQQAVEQQKISARLYAVGRLDKDTDGLLLFTNDNHFAEFLTNPQNRIPKIYRVTLLRAISKDNLNQLSKGVWIEVRGERYFAKPEQIRQLKTNQLEITLTEGKNREVRRLFSAIQNKVIRLTRIGFGKLILDQLNLEQGKIKWLLPEDIV